MISLTCGNFNVTGCPVFLFAKYGYCNLRKNENTLHKRRRMHTGLHTHTHTKETDPLLRKIGFSSISRSHSYPEIYRHFQSTDLARHREVCFLFLSHSDCSVAIHKTIKNFSKVIYMEPSHFRTRREFKRHLCQPHYVTDKGARTQTAEKTDPRLHSSVEQN